MYGKIKYFHLDRGMHLKFKAYKKKQKNCIEGRLHYRLN